MSLDILSKEQCSTILSRLQGNEEFALESYKITPLEKPLEGLIGKHYTVQINYKTNSEETTKTFFLKILNIENRVMFELSKQANLYEKEEFFYTTLLPMYERLNIDVSFAPKSYLCENDLVVLEDLTSQGYKGTNKKKPLDLEHCFMCLETLARFHAASLVSEAKMSKKNRTTYKFTDDYQEYLRDVLFSGKETGATLYFKCSIDGLMDVIDLVPPSTEITHDMFKDALENLVDEIMCEESTWKGFKSTVLHGDLWSNNFLFKYAQSKPTNSKLIDFQTVKYGPPGLDVQQFIMTNTRLQFRVANKQILLKHYHNSLSDLLRAQGLEPRDFVTFEEFLTSCDAVEVPAKIQAIVDRCITFLSDEHFAEAMQSEAAFKSFLFEDRGTYIVDSFLKNEEFREMVTEDIVELRKMIFKS